MCKVKTIIPTATTNFNIKYKPIDHIYGRAEFVFCPTYTDGLLDTLYISALHQDRKINRWELDFMSHTTIKTFHFFNDFDVKIPVLIWSHGWCDEHHTVFTRLYVPDNTTIMRLSLFSDNIHFSFTREL